MEKVGEVELRGVAGLAGDLAGPVDTVDRLADDLELDVHAASPAGKPPTRRSARSTVLLQERDLEGVLPARLGAVGGPFAGPAREVAVEALADEHRLDLREAPRPGADAPGRDPRLEDALAVEAERDRRRGERPFEGRAVADLQVMRAPPRRRERDPDRRDQVARPQDRLDLRRAARQPMQVLDEDRALAVAAR